jgi:predicted ABC-type ATPase
LWLPSPQAALDRVARRIREGGHGIPADVVVRRYWAGLNNMRHLYLPLADVAAIYDNSDTGRTLIAERAPDTSLVVHDTARWAFIEEATA